MIYIWFGGGLHLWLDRAKLVQFLQYTSLTGGTHSLGWTIRQVTQIGLREIPFYNWFSVFSLVSGAFYNRWSKVNFKDSRNVWRGPRHASNGLATGR